MRRLLWTLVVGVGFTLLALAHPDTAKGLTVPVCLAVVLPTLYHRAHERGRRQTRSTS